MPTIGLFLSGAAGGSADPAAGEVNLGYRPPAEKSIDDIVKTDGEDEALQKYKEALLGN